MDRIIHPIMFADKPPATPAGFINVMFNQRISNNHNQCTLQLWDYRWELKAIYEAFD